MTLYIYFSALVIMLASLSGIIFASNHISLFVERNLKVFISFSAGVFVIISYSLFNEAHEEGLQIIPLITSGLLGMVFLEIISHIIPHHHHHEANSGHEHSRIDARRMLLGGAAHNIGDGIILAPAYLAGIWVGIGTTLAILFHEMVRQIAEYFVLREAGYTIKQALLRNLFVSASILIGVTISIYFVRAESLGLYLLPFAAGGFLYIIIRDLVPSIYHSAIRNKQIWRFVFASMLGIVIMYGVTILTPHEHENESEVSESYLL